MFYNKLIVFLMSFGVTVCFASQPLLVHEETREGFLNEPSSVRVTKRCEIWKDKVVLASEIGGISFKRQINLEITGNLVRMIQSATEAKNYIKKSVNPGRWEKYSSSVVANYPVRTVPGGVRSSQWGSIVLLKNTSDAGIEMNGSEETPVLLRILGENCGGY